MTTTTTAKEKIPSRINMWKYWQQQREKDTSIGDNQHYIVVTASTDKSWIVSEPRHEIAKWKQNAWKQNGDTK